MASDDTTSGKTRKIVIESRLHPVSPRGNTTTEWRDFRSQAERLHPTRENQHPLIWVN